MKKGRSGTSVAEVVQIVFLILKLTEQVDWKWVWVLSPTWIMFGIALVEIIIRIILANKD